MLSASRLRAFYMKPLIATTLAIATLAINAASSAQTATVIESVTEKQAYTFSNASGFSITNNGTIRYNGPINSIGESPCCTSAILAVDDINITVTPSSVVKDTKVVSNSGQGNTLSRELEKAEMPVAPGANNLGLQYDVVLGGVTRTKASSSYTIQEKVDSQSLSIFPQFQPSVFP